MNNSENNKKKKKIKFNIKNLYEVEYFLGNLKTSLKCIKISKLLKNN